MTVNGWALFKKYYLFFNNSRSAREKVGTVLYIALHILITVIPIYNKKKCIIMIIRTFVCFFGLFKRSLKILYIKLLSSSSQTTVKSTGLP
jgi:hypothetical protein